MNQPPLFDATPTLHAEIVPLMQQLMKICQRERIPMVLADLRKPLAPSHTYTQTYDPPAA